MRIQDGNVWQVTVILIVIQPISDNELILDLETAEVRVDIRLPPSILVQQDTSLYITGLEPFKFPGESRQSQAANQ